ncbi:uncharacterized protein LOC115213970 [Octopus sinensis]|uniref:Uncharacterized protein LOC115213970 n=1 Tax=Octopus sinensis TaxID=2607531 RepID=A0A6P7SKP5_9MOLL|nr:uncharacterized protein LOC115213970 [Octopus sinensis]
MTSLRLFVVLTVVPSIISVLSTTLVDSASHENKRLSILVFGGNGFIGSATVSRLLKIDHSITVINRGNWYWDSDVLIKPYVRHLKCDRMQSLYNCQDLVNFFKTSSSIYFDTVIDFSAYHPHAVREVLAIFRSKIGLYVLISTDSVYDVCMKNHTAPSKETDAVRPFDETTREDYAKNDNYGHLKLQCEEELRQQPEASKIPFLIYRLPDVIGPKDNTYRWWLYQLWMKLRTYLERPVSLPSNLVKQEISLVYVEDVADIIVQYLTGSEDINDEAYNLAIDETPTLYEVLGDIKDSLNLTDLNIFIEPLTSSSVYLFPSVKLGPVDVSKAKEKLDWKPTSWEKILKEIIAFYEKAIKEEKYEIPRRDVIHMMQKYLTRRPLQVLTGLRAVYGIDYPFVKEEL